MYPSTVNLLSSPLFAHHYEDTPRLEHLERSYHRARSVGRHYGLLSQQKFQYAQADKDQE